MVRLDVQHTNHRLTDGKAGLQRCRSNAAQPARTWYRCSRGLASHDVLPYLHKHALDETHPRPDTCSLLFEFGKGSGT